VQAAWALDLVLADPRRTNTLGQKRAFPRKRLVKFCTRCFRGNVTDVLRAPPRSGEGTVRADECVRHPATFRAGNRSALLAPATACRPLNHPARADGGDLRAADE